MALAIGRRVGPYEILAPLGAGGMGEVYRARDGRLGRDVAIKVVPAVFTSDSDRLGRFEREARVLAALNHPNIATIHGLEESNGGRALVMELVEGATLAEKIAAASAGWRSGGLPIPEALTLARQIADALDAAHDKGIIHRDLKPANVKVTPDGVVKVLDFGLAKLTSQDVAALAQSTPTKTDIGTRAGLIVGTAGYMSPEQARGLAVDKRTDIWAFGCVLYELLTTRAAFVRDTTTDTLAAIVEREPDWSALPPTTPPGIRRLLRRCLEKDVKRRLHDIADARIEIDDALASQTSTASPAAADGNTGPSQSKIRTWQTAATIVAGVAIVAIAWNIWTATTAVEPSTRRISLALHLPPGMQFPIDTGLPTVLAISPGGDQIAYAARDATGHRLYLRRLDDPEASPIPGSEGAIGPFFSPDGQWIAFGANGMLRAVPIAGGAPRTLAEAPNLEGGTWGADETIVFSPRWTSGLLKISGPNSTPETVIPLEEPTKAPHMLPNGRALLFQVMRDGRQFIEVLDIATRQRRELTQGSNPFYVQTGHLVFARGSSVFAAPFDVTRLELSGESVQVLDGIEADGNDTHFAVASDGTLAYVPAASRKSRLLWFDRKGTSRPLDNEPREYSHPRVSPDGTRVVVRVQQEAGGGELWIYDITRGTRARLGPSGPRVSRPIWTADGTRITFQYNSDLYSVPADDSRPPEIVVKREARFSNVFPLAWSRDGRVLAFSAPAPATNRDVWMLTSGGEIMPFLVTPRDERAAMFSPDGRWVVYALRETGREEQVYIQPYPGPGGRVVISPGGGVEPVWSPTGREIFYRSIDGTSMLAVEVGLSPTPSVGPPRQLFAGQFLTSATGGNYWSEYDLAPDGEHFLMLAADEATAPRLNIVVGWAEALRR